MVFERHFVIAGSAFAASLAMAVTPSLAADLSSYPTMPIAAPVVEQPNDVGFFGEVGVGGHVLFGNADTSLDDDDDDGFTVPALDVYGRFAFAPYQQGFGAQLDLHASGFDVDWVDPMIEDFDGRILQLGAAAHLTYATDPTHKYGVFAGVLRHDMEFSDDDFSATFDLNSAAFGFEFMHKPSAATTIFGRAAYVNPYAGSFGEGGDSEALDYYTDYIDGYLLGIGVQHVIAPRWTVGAEVDFLHMDLEFVTMDLLEAELSLAYDLGVHNLSLEGAIAYEGLTLGIYGSDMTTDAYEAKFRLVHRFNQDATTVNRTPFIGHPY